MTKISRLLPANGKKKWQKVRPTPEEEARIISMRDTHKVSHIAKSIGRSTFYVLQILKAHNFIQDKNRESDDPEMFSWNKFKGGVI